MTQVHKFNNAITILLPVLNAAKTLRSAINSIRQQSFQNWELLVLDDASTDDSLRIVRSIEDKRIRVVLQGQTPGLAARLNQGIGLAQGKYIARMDADDIAFPERLARQVEFLESHPEVDLVGTRAVAFRDDGSVIGLLPFAQDHDKICARPWNNIPLAHPTWMGRTEWFQQHRYAMPEYQRAEDQELLLRAYQISTFACLPDVLLAYRQGPFSARRTLTGRTSLLRAQIQHFLINNDRCSLCLSFLLYNIKSFIDIAATLPGLDSLYFNRMNKMPDHSIIRNFSKIYAQYQ
ncbi:MAG: glycosyltransferase [Spartobacteria bacterium]|nr:glycosyltransferase [Spartobacteria bacterium]